MNHSASSSEKRPSLCGRLVHGVWRLFTLLLVMVLVSIGAVWGYCRWMESFIENQLHTFWTEEIFTIDRVEFSPWTHEFTLYGLSWGNPPGYERSRKAIQIRRVRADLELDLLREGVLHFRRVEISDVQLNLEFSTRSLTKIALLMDDPEPEVNLYEAIQFQFVDEPVAATETDVQPSFIKSVRIDTLSVGESLIQFGNISDIPGLNIVLNLKDCFSMRLAPYNRFGIGFEKPMPPEDVMENIIDYHFVEVRTLLVKQLALSSDKISQIYHETFSSQLRECERFFKAIREWDDLLKAAQEMKKLDDKPELRKALYEFLEKYPHTTAAVKRLCDDLEARKIGVISDVELHVRQELVRKSRNTEQAIEEWTQKDWWRFW